MKPYELLEHTADAKFRAYGRTLDEAFAHAVLGMTAIVADPAKMGTQHEHKISIAAKDLQTLLFDLLDELLFLHDTEHIIASAVRELKITQGDTYALEATILGDDSRKWPGNLKAVTYSEMIVAKQPNGTWLIQAVIDI